MVVTSEASVTCWLTAERPTGMSSGHNRNVMRYQAEYRYVDVSGVCCMQSVEVGLLWSQLGVSTHQNLHTSVVGLEPTGLVPRHQV